MFVDACGACCTVGWVVIIQAHSACAGPKQSHWSAAVDQAPSALHGPGSHAPAACLPVTSNRDSQDSWPSAEQTAQPCTQDRCQNGNCVQAASSPAHGNEATPFAEAAAAADGENHHTPADAKTHAQNDANGALSEAANAHEHEQAQPLSAQPSTTKPVPSLGCHSSVSRTASNIFDKNLSQEQVQQRIREEMGPAHHRDLVALAQAYTSFEKSVQEVRCPNLFQLLRVSVSKSGCANVHVISQSCNANGAGMYAIVLTLPHAAVVCETNRFCWLCTPASTKLCAGGGKARIC